MTRFSKTRMLLQAGEAWFGSCDALFTQKVGEGTIARPFRLSPEGTKCS
jgi:hypothetical protein